MTRLRFVLALLAELAAGSAAAQQGITWVGDVPEALRLAKQDGKPVWVLLVEHEAEDRYILRDLLADPAVVEKAGKCVNLAGSRRKHHKKGISTDPPRFACEFFTPLACDEHERALAEVLERWQVTATGSDAPPTPQHLWLSPDGEVLARWGPIGRDRLLAEMELALRAMGRGDPERTVEDEGRLKRLQTALREGRGIDRRVAFQDLLALPLLEARRAVGEHTSVKHETRIRLEALAALPMAGNYDALPLLQQAAGDANQRVQAAGIRGIGELRLPATVPFLLEWPATAERSEALLELPRALALAGPKHERARKWLLQAIASEKNELTKAAMHAVLEIQQPPPALVEAVRHRVASRKEDVREMAAFVLRELGKRPAR